MTDERVNLHDFAEPARRLLPEQTWNYVSGGAGDEVTLAGNDRAWQEIELRPRVLVDVSTLDTAVDLLGHHLAHPILLAPTAAHAQYHAGAEAATLRGAAEAEALAVMSTLGSTDVTALGPAAPGPWWFQLYVQEDRQFTADLVVRAASAGASALVLTVDTPLLGARDKDRRTGGHTVDGLQPPNLAGLTVADVPAAGRPHLRVRNPHLDASVSWSDLDWLIRISSVPVLVKGVLRGDDAATAVEHGAAGVIVSNHGARNLDTARPSARALPEVVAAVGGRVPVLVDGGIRRGTDVAKALSLGADAVLLGRPAIWGLTVGGATGVRDVIDILRAELLMAMALLGAPTLAELTPDLVVLPS